MLFSFSRFQRLIRAGSFGGAAGGHIRQAQCKGAAPACPERSRGKHSEAEGRANQMKFDIFDKRPAKSIDKSHTYGLYLL